MKKTLLETIDPERKLVIFYGGVLFTAEDEHYIVTCEAAGEVQFSLFEKQGNLVDAIIDRHRRGDFMAFAKRHGITDETLKDGFDTVLPDGNQLSCNSNNWIEYLVFNKAAGEWNDSNIIEEGTDNIEEVFNDFSESDFEWIVSAITGSPYREKTA